MQIRRKLTYQFIVIVALLLLFSSCAIYFLSADYRQDDFYNRLFNKATNTVKLLIEVEEVDADLLKRIDKDNPVSLPKEKIIIYNYKNETLYSSDEKRELKIDRELLDEIRLNGEFRYKQGEYQIIGFLFTDKYDRFAVIAGAVDIYGLKKLHNLRNVLIAVCGIGILVMFLTGWIYAGRALKPISRVINEVDNISVTNLHQRVDEGNGQDEIAKLAATFNSLLDRLESAFKMQKNFIANASHELRTPLTAITGQLEVILMNERSAKVYRETIASVLEDIRSLNTTSNRLLLLAQASSESAASTLESLRVDDVIWQARNELIKRNPEYKVEVVMDENMDDHKLTIPGNEQLVKTALLNLMDNGCKYSGEHEVKVTLKNTSTHFVVIFSDKGIGIEEKDLRNIFEPFYRARNVIRYKGHGIGLSLARRIVTLHKGEISVHSHPGEGSVFTVTFPYS